MPAEKVVVNYFGRLRGQGQTYTLHNRSSCAMCNEYEWTLMGLCSAWYKPSTR
ncbi:uncharacterized protein BO66DRAFT_390903 [Aspergillus aculeatinus CBS 121060]|uniref:Uncharacterized protein n=1 Tax=Aspergillus aculeatinus CBS 121060 TaxID=1448322 RepID=A0ACD1HCG1_9EURO|nr:hypothetical protein BO66DRAFT_390903 [Aspergillus aculeatinus CBS 121060]RAH71259.1 hypothetical protein BO66DRAFT_390903 [Aspergillus aculeatinus CBS 121060]